MTTEKEKALELAISQIEKRYGKGSLMKLGGGVAPPIEAIPTGSLALDLALGVGVFPGDGSARYLALRLQARPP